MTPGASRPGDALRGGVVVLTLAIACRVPAIERAFAAALAAAGAVAPDSRGPSRSQILVAATSIRRAARAAVPHRAAPAVAIDLAGRGGGVAPRRPSAPRSRDTDAVPAVAVASPLPHDVPTSAWSSAIAAADAGALATAAYARLAAGDRRGAVRLFDAALAGDDPRRPAWRRQRDALTRHWSGSLYSIVRASGAPGLAVEPVLGGSQSGGAVAYTPDPLSPRPLALTLRGSIAHDDGGRSALAAAGVQWHPVAGVTLAAERLLPAGPAAPRGWSLRLAAGADRVTGRFRLAGYGEGGLIGDAAYAAVQARAAAIVHASRVELDPGVGTWSSFQHDRGATIDRVDVGPGVVARAGRFAAEVDYRFRVAGNAAPASGPVLTLSAGF